jgi:hypothetical protein
MDSMGRAAGRSGSEVGLSKRLTVADRNAMTITFVREVVPKRLVLRAAIVPFTDTVRQQKRRSETRQLVFGPPASDLGTL